MPLNSQEGRLAATTEEDKLAVEEIPHEEPVEQPKEAKKEADMYAGLDDDAML